MTAPRPQPLARRLAGMLLILASVVLLEWLDDITGPDYCLVLLYIVPVLAAAWFFGALAGALTGAGAAAAWFVSELAWHPLGVLPEVIWNASTRLIIFVGLGLLVARVRRDHETFRAANRRLSELLAREALLARTDPITELPNWRAFEEQLGREITRARRTGRPLGVGYLDLDNFKRVNDRFGHGAGDALLRRIAAALRAVLRPEDLLARMGGDEFAFVLSDPQPRALEEIGARLIEQVRALGEGYPGAGLGASVGLVWGAAECRGQEEMIQRADQAMYLAKRAGKGRVHVVSFDDCGPVNPAPPAPGGHERSLE